MSRLEFERLKALNQQHGYLAEEAQRLRQENTILKQTIREALGFLPLKLPDNISLEIPKSNMMRWSERSDKFKVLRKQLAEVACRLIQKRNLAVHQDEILKAFRYEYPTVFQETHDVGETLSRRLRELREWGYLTSPRQGWYFIGPKLAEEALK